VVAVTEPLHPPAVPALSDFHAIVPAGGAGTRLWPLSRRNRPKFLLDLTGSGRSLLQQTWDRLVPLTGPAGITVVTGVAHGEAVAGQLPDLVAENLLTEPSPRESAAAICLAAAVVHRRNADAIVGSFAADHVIRDIAAFHEAVGAAVAAARAGDIVTLGMRPDHPSTSFGYIRMGELLSRPGAPSVHRVARFVEKPDAATAARYLGEGGYRWNAGMFVARADVLLAELRLNRPGLYDGIARLAEAWGTPRRDAVLDAVWPGLDKVAIDYAIAEPAADAGRVAVVPASFGWDDVGDWASLATLLPSATGMRVLGDEELLLIRDAEGVAVTSSGRLIAVLGLEDVVVVDTPDALLVTRRDRAQDVKGLVEALTTLGRDELT
jgi:mannose-1-phosphate guanylyltransferase